MSVVIVAAALGFLMVAAYRGQSVILFAPIAAMAAVLVTDPAAVAPVFSGLFMERMGGFVKLYFPVFLLGALFGKLIELAGFSGALVRGIIHLFGRRQAMLAIVLVTALLTYGGVSVFVVVFATYPFAAVMFRAAGIPKRLVPATIALGALTFTMDALPGTPQIQNIIPTSFFHTDAWSAPGLGLAGSLFILAAGMAYLDWRRRRAERAGEGYGADHRHEPEPDDEGVDPVSPELALIPLVVVGLVNLALSKLIPSIAGPAIATGLPGLAQPVRSDVSALAAIWSVEAALIAGILVILALAFGRVRTRFEAGARAAVAGAMLATINTASEFGFGSVIAALPGFLAVKDGLQQVGGPLVNEALTVTTLAGITGSASGGLSIALGAMAEQFKAAGAVAHIPPEVLHRVASMASGGMDSLPHNGAVITLLAVTGLSHREAYRDIFALTCLKTVAVFLVIALYDWTGLV